MIFEIEKELMFLLLSHTFSATLLTPNHLSYTIRVICNLILYSDYLEVMSDSISEAQHLKASCCHVNAHCKPQVMTSSFTSFIPFSAGLNTGKVLQNARA